jgi:hypothetical protein
VFHCGFSFGVQGVAKCVEDVGVGFMFAPRFHPAMKAVAPVRKSLRIKTAFNILGPMLNPSRAPHSIVGVYHENLVSLTIAFSLFDFRNCSNHSHSSVLNLTVLYIRNSVMLPGLMWLLYDKVGAKNGEDYATLRHKTHTGSPLRGTR